jgi:16S rRNA (cytosine1402-N4)-methyltransferase
MFPADAQPGAAPRHGTAHIPVLLDEVLDWLAPRAGGIYCDATLGLGGHAHAILDRSGPDGRLVGIDRDPEALAEARASLQPWSDRVTLIHARFSEAKSVLNRLGVVPVDGFLVDLGVSSLQLDRAGRGFSFRADGPLDMRMDPTEGETAAELLRRVDEAELERIVRDYGEERHARRIARAIVEARGGAGIETTAQLAAVVARAVPRREYGKDPSTRTFQALRIALNDELGEIDSFLTTAADCLRPGGRLCVIAFHSLEDRIVKRRLRALAGRDGGTTPPTLRILTKHVVVPSDAERARNPRSRSARLRAAERL